ncbi:MAG: ABC transporter permease subunit [Sulfolobales archaeon]
MTLSYLLSLAIALVVGIAMATNKRIDSIVNPIIDILQSIPILGFFPAAILIVISLLPGRLGVELASIILISTSMVWNMIYGVYSAIKSIDPSVVEMLKIYRVGALTKLILIYIPATRKAIATNSAISWAGGWFFVTAAEVISLGSSEYRLKGLGSYIVEASIMGDQISLYIGLAVLISIIMASYLFIWNNAISIKGEVYSVSQPSIGIIYRFFIKRTMVFRQRLLDVAIKVDHAMASLGMPVRVLYIPYIIISIAGAIIVIMFLLYGSLEVFAEIHGKLGILAIHIAGSIPIAIYSLLLSLSRVLAVLALGVAVGASTAYLYIRYRRSAYILIFIGEVLSSIPAIIWWPILAEAIRSGFSPAIVSLIIMFQGSFWYIFFNIVFYGIPSFRKSLLEVSEIYGIKGRLYIEKIFIPSLFPSIVAGLISASGGAWNATIVAEYIDLGDLKIDLGGIGSLISRSAEKGDVLSLLTYTAYMAAIVIAFNKLVWNRILFQKLGRRYYEVGD